MEQIPDISGEEVDDLTAIRYENKEICAEICIEAKRRLNTLSVSRIETITRTDSIETEIESPSTLLYNSNSGSSNNRLQHQVSSFRSPAKTLSSSLIQSQSSQQQQQASSTLMNDTRRSVVSIFPRLDQIAEQRDDESIRIGPSPPQTPPPPTYSDSESQYSCVRTTTTSYSVAVPSAPDL